MADEIQATEAPTAPVVTPAPSRNRKPAAAKASTAKGRKPAAKTAAKAPRAKAAPIPKGMTRSRGALIPAARTDAKGVVIHCGFTGAKGQCANPGRWERVVAGRKVLSCTTHKNAAKVTIFAAAAKARKGKATVQA